MSHSISKQVIKSSPDTWFLAPTSAINTFLQKRKPHLDHLTTIAFAHERCVSFDQPQWKIQIAHETKLQDCMANTSDLGKPTTYQWHYGNYPDFSSNFKQNRLLWLISYDWWI